LGETLWWNARLADGRVAVLRVVRDATTSAMYTPPVAFFFPHTASLRFLEPSGAPVRWLSISLHEETTVGPYKAVVPSISGRAWITGFHSYCLDAGDPYPQGYVVADSWGVTGKMSQ
jgi:hypothetical protein